MAVSEPVDRPADDRGTHWVLCVLNCINQKMEYWNSLIDTDRYGHSTGADKCFAVSDCSI